MEPQTENQTVNNQPSENTLPDILDIVSGVGLLGGVIGSALNNVILAGIPVSIAVAIQIANRRQLALKNAQLHQAGIVQVTQQLHHNQSQASEELQQLQQTIETRLNQQSQGFYHQIHELSEIWEKNLQTKIDDLKKSLSELGENHHDLSQFTQELEQQQQKLKEVVDELHHIESFSQQISMSSDEVHAYYQRGLSCQKLGDKEAAIKNYTEVLHRDTTHAKAYHYRGILLAELGNRKQAVEDLRLAAKYYFEQEDLNSYRQARDLSKEFYDTPQSVEPETDSSSESSIHQVGESDAEHHFPVTQAIAVGNLFA